MRWPPWSRPPAQTAEPEPETRALTLEDHGQFLIEGFGNEGDVTVTPSTSLRCSAAYASVRLIADTVGELPVHVFQRRDDGERERRRDHPADRILNGFAAPWMTGSEARRLITLAALQDGRGYARAIRVRGELRELHPLRGVTRRVDDFTGEPIYERSPSRGGMERLGWQDVVEVSAFAGESPLRLAAEAIRLSLLLEKHGTNLWKNGARPGAVASPQKSMGATAIENMKKLFNAQHGGAGKSGKVAWFPEPFDFKVLSLTSTDAQYLENRRHQITEIGRFFGLGPPLLGLLEGATFTNTEALTRLFLTFALQPWLRAWEGAITRTLLTAEERDAGIFVEFVTADLVRADLKARFEAMRQAVGGPWITPNQARGFDNMPSVDGGDALYPPQGTAPSKPTGTDDES